MTANTRKKKLTRSQEDYLEAIWELIRVHRVARVRDIAARLGVSMPSVTGALKNLAARGLVNYDPYQVITLTDRGREVAEQVQGRHRVLAAFLTDVLGLDADVAAANACRMEHAIDQPVLERLEEFAEFVRSCPRTGADWVEAFAAHGADGAETRRCRRCLKRASGAFESRITKRSKT